MRPAAALLGCLLAPLLGGCTVEAPQVEGVLPGGPASGAAGGPGAAGSGVPPAQLLQGNLTPEQAVLDAPAWGPRYAWRWSITDRQGGPGGTQHLVVLRDLGPDWLVGTADRGEAVLTAFEGRSNYGRMEKAALSGYDGGQPTRFFDFPMRHNHTWTMQLRSVGPIQVEARFAPEVDGKGPGFVIEGRNAAGFSVSYTYAPSVAWMTRFTLADADGPRFTRSLAAHTTNYTGPWFYATSRDVFQGERNASAGALPELEGFDAPGADLLHLRAVAEGTGAADLRVLDPAGELRYNWTVTGPARAEADLPALPGRWQVAWSAAGSMALALRVAAVEVEEGSF